MSRTRHHFLITSILATAITSQIALAQTDAANTPEQTQLQELRQRIESMEKELKALTAEKERIDQSLSSNRISEDEPEITARLKGAETDALHAKKSTKLAETLEGIKAGFNLSTVAQRPSGLPSGTKEGHSNLNYRADATVELPLPNFSDTQQRLFTQIRFGQGLGLNAAYSDLGYFASAPNAVAFRASGANPDDSVAILGQAWYQATIPLPFGGFLPHSRQDLTLTFGKVDLFAFFDQNLAAGDETRQFLNSIFVHNPLLDAGGEIGVDANGFQPGLVISYGNHFNKPEPWGISFGVFGAGSKGANYQRTLSSPFVIVQAEKRLHLATGLPGNYRAYIWRRSKASSLEDGITERHQGFGFSIDQKVSSNISVFARFGRLTTGQAKFNDAIATGVEFNGSLWGRGADAVGLGLGWLRAGAAYRGTNAASGCLGWRDGNDACLDTFTYTARGSEMTSEIYYRFRIAPQFDLSPDLQWVRRPGANPQARSALAVGLRANISF